MQIATERIRIREANKLTDPGHWQKEGLNDGRVWIRTLTTVRIRIREAKKLTDPGHWQKETDFCYSFKVLMPTFS